MLALILAAAIGQCANGVCAVPQRPNFAAPVQAYYATPYASAPCSSGSCGTGYAAPVHAERRFAPRARFRPFKAVSKGGCR